VLAAAIVAGAVALVRASARLNIRNLGHFASFDNGRGKYTKSTGGPQGGRSWLSHLRLPARFW
jgi:hypothetical protein